jgi:hypothetical protein
MNNQTYQEYMNLISDAYRSIYELVEPQIGNKSFFLQNYLKNINLITDQHPKYQKILKIDLISSDKTEPKIKAEYLLDNNRVILDFINKNYV